MILTRYWRRRLSDRSYKHFIFFKLAVIVYAVIWGALVYVYFSVIYPKPDLLAIKVIAGVILFTLGPDLDTMFMSYKKFYQKPEREVAKEQD